MGINEKYVAMLAEANKNPMMILIMDYNDMIDFFVALHNDGRKRLVKALVMASSIKYDVDKVIKDIKAHPDAPACDCPNCSQETLDKVIAGEIHRLYNLLETEDKPESGTPKEVIELMKSSIELLKDIVKGDCTVDHFMEMLEAGPKPIRKYYKHLFNR